jgi:hypothetical protein
MRVSHARPSANRWPSTVIATGLLAVLAPAALQAQTTATWNGTTGNWIDVARWSTNPNFPNNNTPPGTTYNAIIGAAGTYTVTLNTGVTVSNLTLNDANAMLAVSGGTLTLVSSATLTAGVVQMTGGTLSGGTYSSTGCPATSARCWPTRGRSGSPPGRRTAP